MIHYLNSDAFGGQLRDPKIKGVNPLFRAKIRVGEESLHCYVKPVPDKVWERPGAHEYHSLEILSEAMGHTLAELMGFSVAKNAGVIELDREQIPERVRQGLDAVSPLGPQDSYLAWFCQDTTYPNLYQKHIDGLPKFMEERRAKRLAVTLAKNKSIPGIVSFDAWLQNSDRHLGNLLWSPGGSYTLIDHGRLFGWPDWTPQALFSRQQSPNRLMEIIDNYVPQWSRTLPTQSARFFAYNAFSVTFRERGAIAATELLSNFLDDAGSSLIVDFLTSRLDNDRYSKELGMLAIS